MLRKFVEDAKVAGLLARSRTGGLITSACCMLRIIQDGLLAEKTTGEASESQSNSARGTEEIFLTVYRVLFHLEPLVTSGTG